MLDTDLFEEPEFSVDTHLDPNTRLDNQMIVDLLE